MECMILDCGGAKYYVDKTLIEGFLGEPKLFVVPGSGESVAGISLYQGCPVMYYKFAGAQSEQGAEAGRCGIILRGDGRWLRGVVGTVSGEASVPETELCPVYPGVWELQSDSIK